MSKLLLGIAPVYVQKTINAQLRFLFSTSYFLYRDKEDLLQDFLLFYLEQFALKDQAFDEPYVVVSIRNFAKKLLKEAHYEYNHRAELADDVLEMIENIKDTRQTLAEFEAKWTVEKIFAGIGDKERDICLMIMGGASLNEIARVKKVSKNTIYKILEKISKF